MNIKELVFLINVLANTFTDLELLLEWELDVHVLSLGTWCQTVIQDGDTNSGEEFKVRVEIAVLVQH